MSPPTPPSAVRRHVALPGGGHPKHEADRERGPLAATAPPQLHGGRTGRDPGLWQGEDDGRQVSGTLIT